MSCNFIESESKKSHISNEPSNAAAVLEVTVPSLSAQSSSLMEGSGEFDPSDFTNHDINEDISSENFAPSLIADSSVTGVSLVPEINHSLTCEFESTKLILMADTSRHTEVPKVRAIDVTSRDLHDSQIPIKVYSPEEKNEASDSSREKPAIELRGPDCDSSKNYTDNKEEEVNVTDMNEDNLLIPGASSNGENGKEAESTLETAATTFSGALTNSISTMSNSAASSTMTAASKSSFGGGLISIDGVGSESSELNSSMSSSNTTLFASKTGLGPSSVVSTDEGGDNVDEVNSILQDEKIHTEGRIASQVQEVNSEQYTLHPIDAEHQNDSIIAPTTCDIRNQTSVNAIEIRDDEGDRIESSVRNISNLIENAMVDNGENQAVNGTDVNVVQKHTFDKDDPSSHIADQISETESPPSSIESSSRSYELIKHESMVSLTASTASSFNIISKTSDTDNHQNQPNNLTSNSKHGQNSSGHTSGDDMEAAATAASSDIEVISSPIFGSENGNGNCKLHAGNNRRLRDKYGTKLGHARSSSEVSGISVCSDSADSAKPDSSNALESRNRKIQKKLQDMTELLEAREVKLVELSKQNLDLMEKNDDLTSQVKEARQINSRLSETHLASEEFTQRLSSMEQKLQKIIVERDSLKEENKKMKHEAALRMTKTQVEEMITEKDEIINDLRAEGENLSRQVGKQSEVIKKIRQKDKGLEKDLKGTKERLEKKLEECDRLKKSLSAKDEVETRQIEAVRDLTSANSNWQEEAIKRDSELEDAKDQATALRISLESAFREISEMKKTLAERDDEAKEEELIKEQKLKKELQEELRRNKELTFAETDALRRTIDELRCTLADEERSSARREEHLRRERDDIQQRLALSDARHDELSGSVSTATRPLLRQIESLQLSLSESQANADRAERGLGDRLQQTTIQLASCQERERSIAEQYRQTSARLATMDSRLENAKRAQAEAEARSETISHEMARLENAKHKEEVALKALKNSFVEEVGELKREKDNLENALESEKLVSHEESRKVTELEKQLAEKERKLKEVSERDLENLRRMSENVNRSSVDSPTPSLSSVSQRNLSFENENDVEERGNTWMVSRYFIMMKKEISYSIALI